MKSLRLGDLRELLQSSAFSAWWTGLAHAAAALQEARLRHEDLSSQAEMMTVRSELAQRRAVEVFSRAGDAEDEATRAAAEAQRLENRALELVAQHEEQRVRTSDLWIRLGAAEKAVEERREAPPRPRRAPRGERGQDGGTAALRSAEREHEELRAQYAAEDEKRSRLWEDVEAAWAASFERSLVAAEHGLAARRARREAERLFQEAEERRGRAKQLAKDADAAGRELAEAQRRRVALLAKASEEFGCTPGESFLYWRHAGDKRSAWAVALADEVEGTNLHVKALGVYVVARHRGVALLEPAREEPSPSSPAGSASRTRSSRAVRRTP